MNYLKKKINSFNKKLKSKVKEQNKNKLEEGCFVYELEADSTIPSEYILLMHFIGEIDTNVSVKAEVNKLKNTEAFKELEQYVAEFSGA